MISSATALTTLNQKQQNARQRVVVSTSSPAWLRRWRPPPSRSSPRLKAPPPGCSTSSAGLLLTFLTILLIGCGIAVYMGKLSGGMFIKILVGSIFVFGARTLAPKIIALF
jgi:hypothetical protein